jgi:septal ring factor EnvC (AmiA/AmiB activator)
MQGNPMSVARTRRTSYRQQKPVPVPEADAQENVHELTRRLYLIINEHYSMLDRLQQKRYELNLLEHEISAMEQNIQGSQESIDELQRKIADILKVEK